MDLTWQCVDARAAADVVEWRDAGELGAGVLAASWFESAESRVTEACVVPCSPENDCFQGQCTGTDGSTVVYRQDIVGEGANVETTTNIDVYPIDGTAWDRLTVEYTDTRADDGTTSSHLESWTVSWEGLLVPEWPQDASFVAHRESTSHFGGTLLTDREAWLDPLCSWSSQVDAGIDSTLWTIQMGTETVVVMESIATCPTAASSDIDGDPEGYVDPETWAYLGDSCPSEDGAGEDTGDAPKADPDGCGCAAPAGAGGAAWWAGVVALTSRRRRSAVSPSPRDQATVTSPQR